MEEKIVDKNLLIQKIDSFRKEKYIHVPELAGLVGLPEEECLIKIRGASLEDHLRANELKKQPYLFMQSLIMKMKRGYLFEEISQLAHLYVNPEISEVVVFELTLFQRCVLEPAFTMEEVVRISEVAPGVINKVVAEIVELTALPYKEE